MGKEKWMESVPVTPVSGRSGGEGCDKEKEENRILEKR